jgi:hypothetical protein
MTDKQWGEMIAWLQKNGQQLIVPLTGPIIIRKKSSAEAAEEWSSLVDTEQAPSWCRYKKANAPASAK